MAAFSTRRLALPYQGSASSSVRLTVGRTSRTATHLETGRPRSLSSPTGTSAGRRLATAYTRLAYFHSDRTTYRCRTSDSATRAGHSRKLHGPGGPRLLGGRSQTSHRASFSLCRPHLTDG